MIDRVKPRPKVAAGGIGGAVAIVVVIIIEAVAPAFLDERSAASFVAAVGFIVSWLMPEQPPWKRDTPEAILDDGTEVLPPGPMPDDDGPHGEAPPGLDRRAGS